MKAIHPAGCDASHDVYTAAVILNLYIPLFEVYWWLSGLLRDVLVCCWVESSILLDCKMAIPRGTGRSYGIR